MAGSGPCFDIRLVELASDLNFPNLYKSYRVSYRKNGCAKAQSLSDGTLKYPQNYGWYKLRQINGKNSKNYTGSAA